MKYEAILFDMNGVLIDDEHLHEEAFQQVLSKLGIPLEQDDYVEFFIGKTDRKGFEDYLQNRHATEDIDELIRQKGDIYQELASKGLQGYQGVQEFIETAAQQDLHLAVVTSSTRNEAVSILAGLGLSSYFTAIVAADDVENGKPDPEGYLKGAASLAVDPENCIVIEDAPSGLTAAKSAGMFCVAVLNTHTADELSGADIVTEKLSADMVNNLDIVTNNVDRDLSSHGIVSLIRNQEGKFLLLEDSRELMQGYWAPPHGRCEATDNSEEAGVVRETLEETGLTVKPRKKLLTQEADTKVKTVSFWLVDVIEGELQIDKSETSSYGWFSIDEALGMKLYPGTKIFFEKIDTNELVL